MANPLSPPFPSWLWRERERGRERCTGGGGGAWWWCGRCEAASCLLQAVSQSILFSLLWAAVWMKMAAPQQHQGSDRRQDQRQQDTTHTKVFVGGLAWETQHDAMRRHFEQYGEIVEAVVITDKATGRSKGYGFVTFRQPEAARRACADATPIIDGRRANCNLASLGAHHRARPSFSFMPGNRFRPMASIPATSPHPGEVVYMGAPAYFQQGNYALQYSFPYQSYGYPYSPDLVYQPGMYNPYGGLQYPQIYSGSAGIGSSAMYPYVQLSQPSSQSFSMQLPQVMQYGAAATMTTLPQQSYGFVPLPASITSAGATLGYSSASTVGSPRLSPPPQLLPAQQQQHFSQVPRSEQLSG